MLARKNKMINVSIVNSQRPTCIARWNLAKTAKSLLQPFVVSVNIFCVQLYQY